MEGLIEHIIPIASIKQGIHHYEFKIDDEFFKHFEGTLIKEANLIVKMELDKKSSLIELFFDIQGNITTQCDRCLENMLFDVKEEQRLLVKYSDILEDDLEVTYIPLGSQELNVSTFIYEFIHLSIPMTKTHEDVDQDCPVDLDEFLDENDEVTEEKAPSVWDALKDINTNN